MVLATTGISVRIEIPPLSNAVQMRRLIVEMIEQGQTHEMPGLTQDRLSVLKDGKGKAGETSAFS